MDSKWTIQIEHWSGGPTPSDSSVTKETERRDATESLVLIDMIGRSHQLRILGPSGTGLRIAVEDLSVKRGKDLQSRTINLMGCYPQEFVVDPGETIELNTCTLDAGTTYRLTFALRNSVKT